MDRYISDFEAREGFPELIRHVQQGESFTVTVGGRPVARVTPVSSATAAANAPAERSAGSDGWDALLAEVKTWPIRTLDWKREDLYER